MAALLAGQGVAEVSWEYNIPVSTVSDWNKVAWAEAGRSDDIGELLLDYLRANLKAVVVQAGVFSDPSWLMDQGASEVAVLPGVMCDKMARLLEAFEPSEMGAVSLSPAPPKREVGWMFK